MRLQQFFEKQRDLFFKGDIDGMIHTRRVPMACYNRGKLQILSTKEELYLCLKEFREEILSTGAKNATFMLEHGLDETRDRFPVLVTWDFWSETGQLIGTARIRHFMSTEPDGRWIIDLVEHLDSLETSSARQSEFKPVAVN